MTTKQTDELLEGLAKKQSLAAFIVTTFDGYGVWPEDEKLLRVLKDSGLGDVLEAALESRADWFSAQKAHNFDVVWARFRENVKGAGR